MQKNVLSAIQTSDNLHIGNYLGSITNWLKIQNKHKCYFFVADLHSLTTSNQQNNNKESSLKLAALYIASGIKPDKSTIFIQSEIEEHYKLQWLLTCITPLGLLKRMTQFKDKVQKNIQNCNTGLLIYPILMTADILLYDTDLVPVGPDQKQHLEFTKKISKILNQKCNKKLVKIPELLTLNTTKKIMSLTACNKKMSKSDKNINSRINITDNPDIIRIKIQKAKTDSLKHIEYNIKTRPEISNMINIFCGLSNRTIFSVVSEYQNLGYQKFKEELSDLIITTLEPINIEYKKLIQDIDYIKNILNIGQENARKIASQTYKNISENFL